MITNLFDSPVRVAPTLILVLLAGALALPVLMVIGSWTQWNAETGVFRLYRNPDFINQVKLQLAKRGLSSDAEISTMCRSGSDRGEPSAAFAAAI